MDDFKSGERYKTLKCGHSFKQACIDKWLTQEKRCPVCSAPPL